MDPNEIKLTDLSKSFEYTKACIEIDSIEDIDQLRIISKLYIKLYLKQQEVIKDVMNVKL